MHPKTLFLTLSLLSVSSMGLAVPRCCLPKRSLDCGEAPPSYRAAARHIEGKGIGYTKGYTTVELFAAPPPALQTRWIPFLDARAHIFDDGRIATNIGVGARYLAPFSYTLGINSYYDYRETAHQKYNQYSLGLEALGRVWDFRVTGYLPLGSKHSLYNPSFAFFRGHRLYLKVSEEFAMKGLNAEAGIHIKKMQNMSFYGAFGPYYFERQGVNAIGGRARISGTFLDHIKLELSGSYDPVFHGIIQGEASVIIPFGPQKKIKADKRKCPPKVFMLERALQAVDRQEIVVVDKQRTHTVAIDPKTHKPWNFVFVNNTSASDGSYESPYHTLFDAQENSAPHDVIYVFIGDGSTRGMDQGFVMQDEQKLWGSGMSQILPTTLGTIIIPPMTSGSPLVTYTTGNFSQGIVALANHGEVSGIHIVGSPSVGSGILAKNLSFGTIWNNTLSGTFGTGYGMLIQGNGECLVENNNLPGSFFLDGINLSNLTTATLENNTLSGSFSVNGISATALGTLAITQNTLSGPIAGIGMQIENGGTALIANNLLSGTNGSSPILIEQMNVAQISNNVLSGASIDSVVIGATGRLNIFGNQLLATPTGDEAIEFNNQGIPACVSISNNTISAPGNDGILISSSGSIVYANITGNLMTNSQVNSSILLDATSSAQICAKITGNTMDQKMNASGTGTIFVDLSGNNQGFAPGATDIPVAPGTCSCP